MRAFIMSMDLVVITESLWTFFQNKRIFTTHWKDFHHFRPLRMMLKNMYAFLMFVLTLSNKHLSVEVSSSHYFLFVHIWNLLWWQWSNIRLFFPIKSNWSFGSIWKKKMKWKWFCIAYKMDVYCWFFSVCQNVFNSIQFSRVTRTVQLLLVFISIGPSESLKSYDDECSSGQWFSMVNL